MLKRLARSLIMLSLCICTVCMAVYAANLAYQTITVQYADIEIQVDGIPISPTDVNGKPVEPFLYQGTTYVPARAIGEALGKEVVWDGVNKVVHVGEPGSASVPMPPVEPTSSHLAKANGYTADPANITLRRFLEIAVQPVGKTMYVWGGGWNEADTGAGIEATTIGVSPRWEAFFSEQTASYDTAKTRYQIHDGLDCSGYVGWAIYNLLHTENGRDGFVMGASKMAKTFADQGFGTYAAPGKVTAFTPGDIMSTSGKHVYIVLGQCADKSVVLVHASPAGVQINGTPTPTGNEASEAIALATHYMKTYFPAWYAKFPNCKRGVSYLTNYGQMQWDKTGNVLMSDPDGYAQKNAAEILSALFDT